jgi:multiple sugar transport system ATP-binding protein
MAAVDLRGVTLDRGGAMPALDTVDLSIADGELVAVVGSSGSGKSSLLRVIAGLERPTAGSVWLQGSDVTRVEPRDRNVAMVFQEHMLYHRRTAGRNIAFPLEVERMGPDEREVRVQASADLTGVGDLLDRYPFQLSAGGKQAVATARALAREGVAALLMDEPLANLDARRRSTMRVELRRLHRRVGVTMVYVTNDSIEAMALGDRLAVLDEGRLTQVGEPLDVYRRPATQRVASLVGEMSMVPAEIVRSGRGWELLLGRDRLHIDPPPSVREWEGRPIDVGVRPEHLSPTDGGADFHHCLHGTVVFVQDTGDRIHAEVDLGVASVTVRSRVDGPRVASPGRRIELEVAVDRLHFFDPATGAAIR